MKSTHTIASIALILLFTAACTVIDSSPEPVRPVDPPSPQPQVFMVSDASEGQSYSGSPEVKDTISFASIRADRVIFSLRDDGKLTLFSLALEQARRDAFPRSPEYFEKLNKEQEYQDNNTTNLATSNIENILGTQNADELEGDAGDNLIDGNGGADTYIASLGSDTYIIHPLASKIQDISIEGFQFGGYKLDFSNFENFDADLLNYDDNANINGFLQILNPGYPPIHSIVYETEDLFVSLEIEGTENLHNFLPFFQQGEMPTDEAFKAFLKENENKFLQY